MKKTCILFALACFLLTVVSCNMEKRLYRNGWYMEKNHHTVVSQEQSILPDTIIAKTIPQKETELSGDSIHPDLPAAENTPAVPRINQKLKELRGLKKELKDGDPLVKMTYADARASMAKKGCQPNKTAMTVYYLSLASIISLLFGVGFLLAVASLIISVFAINKVIADGNCVEENIAIIKAGQRICWGLLIGTAIATLVFLAVLFAIISAYNGW